MDAPLALSIAAAFVALLVVVALVLRRRPARTRERDLAAAADDATPGRPEAPRAVDAELLGADRLGTSATLVQFSTAYCSRCPGTARLLRRIASERDGVDVVEVDVTARGDLANRFRLTTSPTVLVLDADGSPRTRFDGPPAPIAVERWLEAVAGVGA